MDIKSIEWFLSDTESKNKEYFKVRPEIVCKDGFKFSVQSSERHYCTVGKSVEIGYPSEKEDIIMGYQELHVKNNDPTKSVYTNVPYELVNQVLEKHGGIDIGKTLKA